MYDKPRLSLVILSGYGHRAANTPHVMRKSQSSEKVGEI